MAKSYPLVEKILDQGQPEFVAPANDLRAMCGSMIEFCKAHGIPEPPWMKTKLMELARETAVGPAAPKKTGRPTNRQRDMYWFGVIELLRFKYRLSMEKALWALEDLIEERGWKDARGKHIPAATLKQSWRRVDDAKKRLAKSLRAAQPSK